MYQSITILIPHMEPCTKQLNKILRAITTAHFVEEMLNEHALHVENLIRPIVTGLGLLLNMFLLKETEFMVSEEKEDQNDPWHMKHKEKFNLLIESIEKYKVADFEVETKTFEYNNGFQWKATVLTIKEWHWGRCTIYNKI